MQLCRIVRQFLMAPGIVEQLAGDFALPDTPTMGSYLALAHVPQPLKVVSVVLRPHPQGDEPAPPGVVVFTAHEPAVSLEDARAHGWALAPGVPQPPEAG